MDPGADGSENSSLKDGRALASSSGAFLFSSTGSMGSEMPILQFLPPATCRACPFHVQVAESYSETLESR